MVGYKARTLLAKTAGLNWLVSAVMTVFHVIDHHDPDGLVVAFWMVLATSGTVIASVRYHSEGSPVDKAVDRLVDALIASRPGGGDCQPLRLVDRSETGSTIPVPRRSVL